MYNNGDYGATCTYNHHIVTVGQYQGPLYHAILLTLLLHIASVYVPTYVIKFMLIIAFMNITI